jgi:hypothetical protein
MAKNNMEYYKVNSYDPKTLIPTEIETSVPKELVEEIQKIFDKFDETKWVVTPLMVDPIDMSVILGIMERGTYGLGDIYRVTISTISKDKK